VSNNNSNSATIASQLGRDLDPSVVEALNAQGVNIYGQSQTTGGDNNEHEFEERSTAAEIVENNRLDPAKQPLNRLIWVGIPICLVIGTISFLMFGGGSSKNQVANLDPVAAPKPQPQKDDRDKKIEELQQKIAADNQKRDIAAMTSTPSPTPSPTASPTPSSTPSPTPKVTPSSSPSPIVAKATPPPPQIIYKTVYKTLPPVKTPPRIVYKTFPAPRPVPIPISKTPPSPPTKAIPRPIIVAKAPAPSKTATQSFIPLGSAGAVQRPIRPIRTASRPTLPVRSRSPLASENILLGATVPPKISLLATIVPGTTITGHLLSPMQSSGGNGSQGRATMIRVALDQPLKTNGGYQIPNGAFISFSATVDPQNGAVAATSGDGWDNGKTISIPPGAISLQSANKQPLVATAFAPKSGDLARADTSNALLGAAGEVGNELTKGTSSINVGNGSTIIQNSSNPNIVGAVLKGGFQTWATDQRQRTQNNASQILAGQPIQYLAQGTPVTLTVNTPATIRVAQ
jgi:hypothetical protein